MRKSSRVTLMEAIISIFIFLTILAFAAPTIVRGISRHNLNSAALKAAGDMWDAKFLAMQEGTIFRIDFASGSYQVVRVSDNSVLKVGDLANYGVAITDGSITFDSRGFSSSGAIVLSNGVGVKTIRVNNLGKVKIS